MQLQERRETELGPAESDSLACDSLATRYGSFEDVHGSIWTFEKCMPSVGGIDHFGREMMHAEHGSSAKSSNLGRRRRSSESGMQFGTLVESEGGGRFGQ